VRLIITVCLLRFEKIVPSNKVQEYNEYDNSILIFLLKDAGSSEGQS
jgi:hypothetical protein